MKVVAARDKLPEKPRIVVKLSPDLSDAELKDVCKVIQKLHVDGLIVANTTIQRPVSIQQSTFAG